MMYRNCLGQLEADATISVIGNAYILKTMIDAFPPKKWDAATPVEEIVAEMERDGFDCRTRRDPYGRTVINCTHIETQKAIDTIVENRRKQFKDSVPGFVRFGAVPQNGKSKNFRDGTFEAGVSCFAADFAKDGSYRLHLNPVLEISFLTVSDRQAYRLYGDVVGTGADGEPLLKVTKSVKI